MAEMNRRELLASLAAGAAALSIPQDGIEAAAAYADAHVAGATDEQGQATQRPAYQPKQFTPDEWRLVRSLVDYVIPRDARSGSATDAGVPEFMDFILGEYTSTRPWMKDGLAWMNAECRRRFGKGWLSCDDAQRRAVLDAIAFPKQAAPGVAAGVTFFTRFRDLTASGFWTSRIGVRDIGFMGNQVVTKWEGTPANVLTWLERRR